ncbi:ferrous iron transporter [archaeon SCG-AAA382B04]|nr:ferrous iron transporter [archaeon SCG-AAA382B04]
MMGQYLITFREVLEASLIIGIIIAYMTRTDRKHLKKYVWEGTGLSILASTIIGIGILQIYNGLSETSMELFEGISAFIAVAVLTTMIIWMSRKGTKIKTEVKQKIETAATKGTVIGIISFSFIVVFREAFETILFLTPMATRDLTGTIIGAILGTISALIIAYLIFKVGIEIDIKKFFYFSSILLIFVASGLAGYGTHELIEVFEPNGWIGTVAFDLGIPEKSLLGYEGPIGSIFSVMFGYTTKMSWLRLIIQFGYLIIALPTTILAYKK